MDDVTRHERDLERLSRHLDGGDWFVLGLAGMGACVVLLVVVLWWFR